MANLLGLVIGAALGAFIAWRRKGDRMDILHYTAVLGLIGLIIGTFVGALLIGTINNGLIIMGLDVSEQMMVAGAIIVLAVAFGKKPSR